MAEATVTLLQQRVKELLIGYKDLICGAENELNELDKDLSLLKAILKDASRNLKKDEFYIEKEKQTRECVFEVEDTINACLNEAAAAKSRNPIRRILDRQHVKLAKQIRSLRAERIQPMLTNFRREYLSLGSDTRLEEPPLQKKKVQTIRQEGVVGFEDEEKTIINYIMERKDELDVISIIGMPGLGKTTLAWRIFQNKNICSHFQKCIWVHVSANFNCRDVFLNITKKFTSEDMSGLDVNDLAQRVREFLQEAERFLLVLDDVCNVEAWDEIKDALPKSNGKGKVLITSRYTDVGMRANPTRSHNLPFLTAKESWRLFQLEVFGRLDGCPKELEDIGQLIAERCDGVPLTIVVIGGILADRFTKPQAIVASKKELDKLRYIVDDLIQDDKEMLICNVVASSYDILPAELRECFLYTAVFPKDYEIPVWTLTRLWIAEGLIQPNKGKSLEETAQDYLDELISRNLVMAIKRNPMGEVKTCLIHNVIRLFCKATAEDQKLFQEIKLKDGVFEPPVSGIEEFHRLCLHSNVNKFFSAKPKGQRVRSFLCFSKQAMEVDPIHISTIPDGFKLLRVLDSKSLKFNQFPRKVAKLIHLRYITLCIEDLPMLPEVISQLWNLQTLVVDTKSRSITMKANIWKMIQLRHLKTKAAIVLDPNWEGECRENLQTLSRLSPESCTTVVSEKAHYVKTLGIRGKLALFFKTMSLQEFHLLEKLKLVNDLLNEPASEDPRQGLPQSNCFPPNLRRLTLSNAFLDWENMSTLAEIHSLEVLKLKDNVFTGNSWNAVGYSFHSLQLLLILNADLVHWDTSTDSFPSLRFLVLRNCEKLQEIPEALAEKLETLDIERLSKSAVESARKIEEQKKDAKEQQKGKWGIQFKLLTGPGCEH